jgi:hypothetical protein
MNITIKNNNRILIKENLKEVNINDGSIIQYTGIYYKEINDIVRTVQIETTFIGIVESERYRYDEGITGIYVKPLYIWSIMNGEWLKIVDLNTPHTKYFLYPHLLSLPNKTHHCTPLYFLDTCENKSLDDFIDIQKTIQLEVNL